MHMNLLTQLSLSYTRRQRMYRIYVGNIVGITADAIQILAAFMFVLSFFRNKFNPAKAIRCFIPIFFLSSVTAIISLTSIQSVANHVYNVVIYYQDDYGVIPTNYNTLVVFYAISMTMNLMIFLCLLLPVLFTKFLTENTAIHGGVLEQPGTTLPGQHLQFYIVQTTSVPSYYYEQDICSRDRTSTRQHRFFITSSLAPHSVNETNNDDPAPPYDATASDHDHHYK